MDYKLGIDLGASSLGWAIMKIDNNNEIEDFLDLGVTIFPDGREPKTKEPLCVARRISRGSRNRHDRILLRKNHTIKLLNENGFGFDEEDIAKNPYLLRVKALDEKLMQGELGRVILQICQRRGFKSNRKTDKGEEGGKLKIATAALTDKMLENNSRTIGEFLYKLFILEQKAPHKAQKIRFSEIFDNKKKLKEGKYYPTREMYIAEFNQIISKQEEYYPKLKEIKNELFNAIFMQRPLKEQEVGKCVFYADEPRIYKANPLFQRFRVLQTINQLEILTDAMSNKLSTEQKNILQEITLKSFTGVSSSKNKFGTISFSEIQKQLKLKKISFNLESENRDTIQADLTSFIMSKDNYFDTQWFEFSLEEQTEIIDKITDTKTSDEELIREFIQKYNLSFEQAENIVHANLEDGVGSLSAKAIIQVLPFLEQGFLYDGACKEAGFHHSNLTSNLESLDELPYYAKLDSINQSCIGGSRARIDENNPEKYYGKITNVTVHKALNQLRYLVNSVIKQYGKPCEIAIEFARELQLGTNGLKELEKTQNKNKKDNERITARLSEIGISRPSRDDLQKYKLWEALDKDPLNRRCIYSGEIISETELFFLNRFQIEHILPWSRTFDDSMSNKTISLASANYYKGNKTPYEAFSHSSSPYNYEDVMERAKKLAKKTQWRFNKNAMEKFSEENSHIARALNDTRYMTKLAVEYLRYICKDKNKVYGLPGQMTALFRDNWGLDKYKDRLAPELYRSLQVHHTIDAFVVACMNRADLQKISRNANNFEIRREQELKKNKDITYTLKDARKEYFVDNTLPYPNFGHKNFFDWLDGIIVNYKAKSKDVHKALKEGSTIGALHEDSAYKLQSFLSGTKAIFTCRDSVADLKDKDLKDIQDTYVQKLCTLVKEQKISLESAFKKFQEYCTEKGINKIKIRKEVDFTLYVPVFRTKLEKENYSKAYNEWYIEDGKAKNIKDKNAKNIQKQTEIDLLLKLQEQAKLAYKWYVSGNIYCTEIYQIPPNDKVYPDKAGKWQVEVMTNYMATLNKGVPMWKLKHPEARRVMTIKNSEQIILEINGKKEIYRVKSISQNKQFFLQHNLDSKESARSFAPYLNELVAKKIRKAKINALGHIQDPGFDSKWL